MSLFAKHSQFANALIASNDPATAKRVVIATIERASGDTGIHTHTAALLRGFQHNGIECELANPFTAGPKWLPMFAVRKLILKPVNKTWSLRWYRHWHYAALRESLTRTVLRRPADWVIAQCPVSARAALEVRRKHHLAFGIAMVCHFNFSEATEYRDKGELNDPKIFDRIMKLEKLVIQNVDQVVYVSDWSRHVVEVDRSITPRQSHVIHNGIPADVAVSPISREKLGLRDDQFVLINVGSLEPRKNQLALLDLIDRARRAHPHIHLLIAGDGLARGELEAKIRALNLAGHVSLLGYRTDVPALLAASDLYIHYAQLENCPMILLEAARAHLPIAAIPAGGVKELADKIGGMIALSDNVESSFEALAPLLEDAPLLGALGSQSSKGFEKSFTLEAMMQQYLAALKLTRGEGSQ